MPGNSADFVGQIPAHYDEGLGPHIFESFAADLAKRAAILAPTRTLELAAGTGIVTRHLRDSLAPECELVATDLAPPMLDYARSKFSEGERIRFQQADAMKLPFDDGSFDLVVCQFGVMFFPNKQESYREAGRVLSHDGHHLLNVWGSQQDNPFAAIVQSLLEESFPDDPPGFYKVPFHYHDPNTVLSELREGGFHSVSHEELNIEAEIVDTSLFARGLLQGNPVVGEIATRATKSLEQITEGLISRLEDTFGRRPGRMHLKAHVYLAQRSE